ncbi:MAG: lipase family protein [Candidatus Eremiobacteraeota bacterium]|nr:lipase family protein [Candidatus Eremiobacteraeota bacterium]
MTDSDAPDDSAGPTLEDITAALPAGKTLQEIAVLLANGVCAAYAAYNNGNNLQIVLGGYANIQPFFVYEIDPNGNPFGSLTAESDPAAYTAPTGETNPTCVGPLPVGTPSIGSQLFGFTATANDGSHNILIFRGTVTMQEAGADLLGWGSNTPCMLPTQSNTQTAYGMVNESLWNFYSQEGTFDEDSLATSCMTAVAATMQSNPGVPWYVGSHSLGGAMASLAVFDARLAGMFGTGVIPLAITFGSLHVGDGNFAKWYGKYVPYSVRVANLCDFVPSMVSIEPVTYKDPYVHVGIEATFVWQTWDDWGNHSLANIYLPMVQSHWNVIQFGPRHYPQ